MIDIYCKDGKCPICGSNMLVFHHSRNQKDYKCKNRCYTYRDYLSFDSKFISISVLNYIGDYLVLLIGKDDEDAMIDWKERKVKRMIEYWKKNDRYLMRILMKN